jgi:hypothetical protein
LALVSPSERRLDFVMIPLEFKGEVGGGEILGVKPASSFIAL